jgi:adenine-specific DNA-methyltransferase
MIDQEILHNRARSLRKQHTRAEHYLWQRLKDRRFEKYKFRRQRPVGNYIVDFICLWKKLIIELDGDQHAELEQKEYDNKRTIYLLDKGYRVIRFWNHEILTETQIVLDHIWDELHSLTPALSRDLD